MDHDSGSMVAEPREHESVELARARLEQQKQTLGERHPDYASGLNQLALLMIMHGDPVRAEPLLNQALQIRKETLGERHPDYATNLSSLAGLLWARGDLNGAEPLLRHALEIRWDILGPNHPKSVVSLHSLDQLLKAKRDWAEAESLTPLSAGAGAASDTPEPTGDEPSPATVEHEVTEEPIEGEESEAQVVPVAAGPVVTGSRTEAPSCQELSERVESLGDAFAGVGGELALAAESIRNGEGPPSEELIGRLAGCRSDFAEVREQALKLAGWLRISGAAMPALANLEEIGELVKILTVETDRHSKLGNVKTRALTVLDHVLTLRHADRSDFGPLAACHEQARELRQTIEASHIVDLPAEASALAEGDHPLSALLGLVPRGNALSDENWANSLDIIERTFGKPLSVAAARSKIVSP